MRLPWLLGAFVLALALAVANEWAFRDAIYYYYPWFDTLTHGLGGAALGTLVIALWPLHPRRMWYAALIALALVGWEFVETAFRVYDPGDNYALDTASDLLFGTLGSLVPYGIARMTAWKNLETLKALADRIA